MALPSSPTSLPLPIGGWLLPMLGMLLAGLGVGMIAASVGESVSPAPSARPANGTASSAVIREAITDRFAPAAPMSTAGSLPWGPARSGAGEATPATPGRSGTPSSCLGADLATGQRAESAHLATVPLLRLADCGDARDAILGLAALPYLDPTANTVSQPTGVVAASPQADDVDIVAAAFYGPPDRKPQATLEDEMLDGGRGRARGYLERMAAARGLAP